MNSLRKSCNQLCADQLPRGVGAQPSLGLPAHLVGPRLYASRTDRTIRGEASQSQRNHPRRTSSCNDKHTVVEGATRARDEVQSRWGAYSFIANLLFGGFREPRTVGPFRGPRLKPRDHQATSQLHQFTIAPTQQPWPWFSDPRTTRVL